jgi:hypothetical protein
MKLSLIDSKSRSRIIRHWPLLCALLFLLVPTLHGQTTPSDVPLGFMPGIISDYAGTGTSGSYTDGSLPAQVPISGGITAIDSHGNVYIAGTSGSQVIYVVYGGGSIPGALANVTTKATSPFTPLKGRIYQIAGFGGSKCGACEGQTLNLVSFVAIGGLAIDSQDNLYYSDGGLFHGKAADVVRKVDATQGTITTVAGKWGVASSSSDIGDGNLATKATLNGPVDIKLDFYGNLFILDSYNAVVRAVYSGSQAPPILTAETVSNIQAGYIYTVAGQVQNFCGTEGCGDGSSAISAQMNTDMSIGVDTAGNLYIANTDYNTSGGYIRVVYAGGTVPKVLSLYLKSIDGTPTSGDIYPVTGYSVGYAACASAPCGDGSFAANVEFGDSYADEQLYMTLDDLGNIYIADLYGPAVRKIDTSGYASTIAGIDDPTQSTPASCSALSTASNFSTDCLAYNAAMTGPTYISFDKQNNLYITDPEIVWQVVPLLEQTLTLPAFDPATVTYGVNPITLDATSDTKTPIQYSVSTSTPSGIGTINVSQLIVNGAGSITVTALQPQTDIYLAATSSPQTLTVNKAATLVVTASDKSATPGSFDPSNPGFTFKVSGFVHGDTAATSGGYSGAPSFTTNPVVTDSSTCGTFSIIPSNANNTLSSTNYEFASFVPGTLSITGSTIQAINFPAFSSAVTYGQTTSVPLSASTDSMGPVTFTVVSGPGTIVKGTSTLNITGAGSIVVQAIQQGTCTYAASPAVTQTLTVNPAALTVTGPTVTTTYGITLDPTTFPVATINGFAPGDTAASVLTGSAHYSIPSTTPNASTTPYPITVSQGTLQLDASAATNYTFATFVNGSLTVNQAAQTINFNPIPSAQTYGNLIQMTAVATSGLPVIFTTTGPAYFYNGNNSEIGLNGVGTVTVIATQTGNSNYLPASSVSQTLYVGQFPVDITATNFSREQGAPNPTFTYSFPDGFVDIPSAVTGVPVLTTTATQSSPPGTYSIVVDTSTMTSANYKLVPINGTLTITQPGSYAITTNPTQLTIARGQHGQATVTITPSNGYEGTITLTCGTLPANVTCTITPSTYTFTGYTTVTTSSGTATYEYPQKGTILINTTAATAVGTNAAQKSNVSLAGLLIPGALAGLFLVFARKRVAKIATFWSLCALLALGIGATLGLTSCGGSSVNTTAATGTQTITLTGTGTTPSGGTVSATVPLTVTIQ